MSEHDIEYVSEEEAARLWQRAAQLQAEAARRAEERDHGEERALASSSGDQPEGYAVDHVRAAAMEAGIGEEFLDAALRDLGAERALPDRKRPGALTKKLLGNPVEAIVCTRVIKSSPEEVLEAMEEVLPTEAFQLSLVDRVGDPLDGGVLVFDIMGISAAATQTFSMNAAYAEIKQVYLSMRPMADGATELTARSPVFWTRPVHLLAAGFFTGGGGGVGLLFGGVAATSIAATLGGAAPLVAALAALVASGGAGLGGAGGYWGYKAMMEFSRKKGVSALESLLSAVAVRAQRGFGITWRATDGELPAGDDAKALPPETTADSAAEPSEEESASTSKNAKDGSWYPA